MMLLKELFINQTLSVAVHSKVTYRNFGISNVKQNLKTEI